MLGKVLSMHFYCRCLLQDTGIAVAPVLEVSNHEVCDVSSGGTHSCSWGKIGISEWYWLISAIFVLIATCQISC